MRCDCYGVCEVQLIPVRTAVSFWGQLGENYLEFECLVPKTGLEFESYGLVWPISILPIPKNNHKIRTQNQLT